MCLVQLFSNVYQNNETDEILKLVKTSWSKKGSDESVYIFFNWFIQQENKKYNFKFSKICEKKESRKVKKMVGTTILLYRFPTHMAWQYSNNVN